MDTVFIAIIVLVCLIVLAVLSRGLYGFMTDKDGSFNRSKANQIMRARIKWQAIAVALIVAYALLRNWGIF